MRAYVNRIATATPPHDVHAAFLDFARVRLLAASGGVERRARLLFDRMAAKGGIGHRYSFLCPAPPGSAAIDTEGFYRPGAFPGTAARMRLFERHAPTLALQAVAGLGDTLGRVSHLIVTGCTGVSAPGLDLFLLGALGLSGAVERTVIGFMGCYAGINALKTARHIVRSEPGARVLVLNLELCTLHLQETHDLESVLSFMIFADGCAASLVSADPVGIALDRFHAVLAPETAEMITWRIGDQGFDMVLSGRVPAAIGSALTAEADAILDGAPVAAFTHWAVHPGGRSVLDAVAQTLALPDAALAPARAVLQAHGNMSSASVMFVLARMLAAPAGQRGCAMAFGPGLVAETMLFTTAGGG